MIVCACLYVWVYVCVSKAHIFVCKSPPPTRCWWERGFCKQGVYITLTLCVCVCVYACMGACLRACLSVGMKFL